MPSFGGKSTERLANLCPELREIAESAILVIDFSVIETERSKETQQRYYDRGVSQVQWPNSKHNTYAERPLAEAMDLWPYVSPFGALSAHPDQIANIADEIGITERQVKIFICKSFGRLAGVVEACAAQHGHKIRLGMDWDGDGNQLDQSFHDLPHFELVR